MILLKKEKGNRQEKYLNTSRVPIESRKSDPDLIGFEELVRNSLPNYLTHQLCSRTLRPAMTGLRGFVPHQSLLQMILNRTDNTHLECILK